MILDVFSILNNSMILVYDLTRKTQDSKDQDKAELHLAVGKKTGDSCVSA